MDLNEPSLVALATVLKEIVLPFYSLVHDVIVVLLTTCNMLQPQTYHTPTNNLFTTSEMVQEDFISFLHSRVYAVIMCFLSCCNYILFVISSKQTVMYSTTF